jgi:hypothetical protein
LALVAMIKSGRSSFGDPFTRSWLMNPRIGQVSGFESESGRRRLMAAYVSVCGNGQPNILVGWWCCRCRHVVVDLIAFERWVE